jgi:prevent-host-death family protein
MNAHPWIGRFDESADSHIICADEIVKSGDPMISKVSVAEAKSSLSELLKRARQGPVIVTRRGEPDAVILPFAEYERLRRLWAYSSMVRLARELDETGVTATELYEDSRRELEERP